MPEPMTLYLKWDGICLDGVKDPIGDLKKHWANQGATLPKAPTPPAPQPAVTTTTPDKTKGPVLSAQRAEVTLVSVSKPFAPMQEYCAIEISIKNIERAGCLVFQIHDVDGKLVYAERMTQRQIWGAAVASKRPPSEPPPLAWKADEDRAQAERRKGLVYADALRSPYTVTVWLGDAECSDPEERDQIGLGQKEPATPKKGPQIHKASIKSASGALPDVVKAIPQATVRLCSLALEIAPWADLYQAVTQKTDLTRPGGGKAQIQWVQYKLNELGFPAGPLTGTLDDETKQAIRRFRMASKVLYQRPWQPSPDKEFVEEKPGVLDGLGVIDDPLLAELEKGTPKRVQLDPRVVADPPSCREAKLFVDQDRTYLTIDEMGNEPRLAAATVKHTVEQGWLVRPQIPLRAIVFLTDSKGKPVRAPAAAAGARIRWSWTGGGLGDAKGGSGADLPTPTTAEPSQTKAYFRRAMARVKSKIGGTFENAPVRAGGLITGTAADARAVFRALPESPFAVTVVEEHAVTPTFALAPERPGLAGESVVVFAPSTIAGDAYLVEATLELAPEVPEERRKAILPADESARKAGTGWITIWRRLRIAAHVSWPQPSASAWDDVYKRLHPGAGGLDWDGMWAAVRKEYAHCFVEITGPALRRGTGTFPADFADKWTAALDEAMPKGKLGEDEKFWDDAKQGGFSASAWFPVAPRVKGLSATSPDLINGAVRDLLQEEITARAVDDVPKLRAFKKWIVDWATKDETPPAGMKSLSPLLKDAYLVDASEHFGQKAVIWEEKTEGGLRTFFKPLSTVVGSTDLAPWAPRPDWVLANQAKSGTTPDLINARVKKLLAGELAARHATDEQTDTPCVKGFAATLIGFPAGIGKWAVGNDAKIAVPEDALLPAVIKGDLFLKEAAKHYKAELTRLAETRNFGPEKKIFRYKRFELPKTYVPSRALSEKIAASLRDSVGTQVNQLIKKTQVVLMGAIEEAAFADTEPGIVILDFKPHPEIELADADGATERFLAKIFAMANGNGLVIIDQAHLTAYKWYHLFAHELAHCLFLKHWKNSGGFEAMDHDHADDNCLMSYAAEKDPEGKIVGDGAHYQAGRYAPHFCGKCNLKLRGWNLRAKLDETDGKGDKVDLLPVTSDDSKTVKVIDYVDPVVPFTPRSKAKIPAPALLDSEATTLIAQLLEESTTDAAKRWICRVNDPGVVRLVGNPKKVVKGARPTMVWELIPMEIVPGGTPWANPAKEGPRIYDGLEKPAWQESLEYFATLGGRTMATDRVIELNSLFHYCSFTDLVHETWHLAQKMGGDAPLYEGITDFFAAVLGRRVGAKAGDTARFAYEWNPSYSEFALSVIDVWLPAIGVKGLAEIYLKDAKHLATALDGATTGNLSTMLMESQAFAARDLFRAHPDGAIRAGKVLRPDIESAVTTAPVDVQADVRAAIHEFMDFLDGEAGKLTPAKQGGLVGKDGLVRSYEIARLTRRMRKQHASSRMMELMTQWNKDAAGEGKELRGYAAFEQDTKKNLREWNDGPKEPDDVVKDTSAGNDGYWR